MMTMMTMMPMMTIMTMMSIMTKMTLMTMKAMVAIMAMMAMMAMMAKMAMIAMMAMMAMMAGGATRWKMCYQCKWPHLVAECVTNTIKPIQVALPSGQFVPNNASGNEATNRSDPAEKA